MTLPPTKMTDYDSCPAALVIPCVLWYGKKQQARNLFMVEVPRT
jgi:hypothetical protein